MPISQHALRVELARIADYVDVAHAFRKAIGQVHRDPLLGPATDRLRQVLIHPLAKELDGVDRLVIVPDGPLFAVPWSILLTDMRRARDLRVEVAPSIKTWLVREERRSVVASDPKSPVLVAADFREGPKGAREETQRLTTTLSPARLLAGSDVSREQLLQAIRGYRYVYLAAEAIWDKAHPDQSYQILGQGNRMTARDIFGLRGRSAIDLVVLDVQGSARQRAESCDDERGLVGAFLEIGARVVVRSWAPTGRNEQLAVRLFTSWRETGRLDLPTDWGGGGGTEMDEEIGLEGATWEVIGSGG